MKKLSLLVFLLVALCINAQEAQKKQPNILWLVTDDQRADALECYNMATRGTKESPLGYVSSPNIDQLASEGAMFVNAFCNSPVCGPSRGSMVSGRYPFRISRFGFEMSHQNPDFIKDAFPQTLQKRGYNTAAFGKADPYIYRWGPGQGFYDPGFYNYRVHFKHHLQRNDVGDLWKSPAYGKEAGTIENVRYRDGTVERYYLNKKNGKVSEEDKAKRAKTDKEFDILRIYTTGSTSIIGGENPQPAGKTVDAMIVKELRNYLENENKAFTTTWGEQKTGANPDKPLMVNMGFHLPHTPTLPPKEYRDKFKKLKYNIPEYTDAELATLPEQLTKTQRQARVNTMTKKEKLQIIQDYYAFCAYGDALIGEAVQAFKDYSERHNQEYLIVYVVGDHNYHLGEQGKVEKAGPWRNSIHGALIVVSSDKTKVPEGLIQRQITEYVDVAPTILNAAGLPIQEDEFNYLDGYDLMDFIGNDNEKREYSLGEIAVISGPRAYMRTKDFGFSMRTRPFNNVNLNKDIKWALECSVEDAELALYDLRNDPYEHVNVANKEEYQALAQWFRMKLGTIVLGDGRVECDWSKPNTYALSNFAIGADDKKLDIPAGIIPKVK